MEQLAETLGALVIEALLGKAAVPDDSPYTTGGIGLLGTKPSQEALEECDTLLVVGSSFPYIEFFPKPGQARGVQIDLDPLRIGLRYPVEVGLIGDSRATLRELLPMLRRNEDRRFLAKAQDAMKDWWKLMEEQASRQDKPMKPQVVAWELGKRLRDDAIVSCDSGTIASWFARHIPVKRGQMHSLSGTLATMANGLPYTIAAQIAHPQRQCIGFVGDGGFTMLMGEIATAVKYELPIKIVIVKNNSLGQIKWEQMVFLGNPEYACDLHPIDFAAFARACGAHGVTVDDPVLCGDAIEDALREDIRQGTPVVGLEPSCVAVFRDEMLNLFPGDQDAQRLSRQVFTLGEFLAGEETAGRISLPRLERKALLHGHCHQKAVLHMDDAEKVLRGLGLDLEVPDSGCCGMAGSFGFEKGERYRVSVAVGEQALLPAVREAGEETLIVATGFSCREQIACRPAAGRSTRRRSCGWPCGGKRRSRRRNRRKPARRGPWPGSPGAPCSPGAPPGGSGSSGIEGTLELLPLRLGEAAPDRRPGPGRAGGRGLAHPLPLGDRPRRLGALLRRR